MLAILRPGRHLSIIFQVAHARHFGQWGSVLSRKSVRLGAGKARAIGGHLEAQGDLPDFIRLGSLNKPMRYFGVAVSAAFSPPGVETCVR
jgi:hypothetical protein